MKKLFSLLSLAFVSCIVGLSAQCCNNAIISDDSIRQLDLSQPQQASEVKVYYFHATRRCATCEAVEAVTEETLKEYYGDKIAFRSINSEEEKDNPMIVQYQISGQTLLIIKGDKVINLTNDAFLYAQTNPDKFKKKLKSAVDSMM